MITQGNELLKKIKYSKNLIYENINRIHEANKPIGIYGNGIYAGYLVKNLKKWAINVDFYVIDDEYYNDNMNPDVIKISSLGQHSDSILIIGFETLIGKEAFLRDKIAKALFFAPGIEILEFEHCYICNDLIDYKYILDNYEAFQQTYNALSDELSKRVMVEFLNTCISGRSELLGLLSQESMYDYDYEILYSDPNDKGIILECGAYDGKTAIELDDYLTSKKSELSILALEPDEKNYDLLCNKTNKRARIMPLRYGAASENGTMLFDQQSGSGSTIIRDAANHSEQYSEIQVRSVDSIMEEYGRINSVLMDIEGSELDALNGSLNVIEKNKPKFAVRIYHKKDDLISIPQFFINLKTQKYDLFLRNSQNTRGYLDVTLYAI